MKLTENEYLQFVDITDIADILHSARFHYWVYPNQSREFEAACQRLKEYKRDNHPSLPFGRQRPITTLNADHYYLFDKLPPHDKLALTKTEKIELAIAQAYNLLSSPDRCVPYLKFLDTELARYFKETFNRDLPELNRDAFEFKSLDGLDYPIPKNINYAGLKKEKALPNYLISYFRNYGLAHETVKWIGFVDYQDADEAVRNGTFVTEEVIGPGLMHGKLSHAIQLFIILCAMNDGEIEYVDINDFNDMIVTKDSLLWTRLRDRRSYHVISFADPYRLNSIIMREGDMLGIYTLSKYLTDCFCKGYIKMYNVMTNHETYSGITLDDFYIKLTDYQQEKFNTPGDVLNYSIAMEKKKGSVIIKESGTKQEAYAIIKKTYLPNTQFQMRLFGKPDKTSSSISCDFNPKKKNAPLRVSS